MRVEEFGQKVRAELAKAVVGQEDAVDLALVALLANGHILLEGLPGLAKTLLVRSLALTLNFEFGRVQFTPDLMPSDVLGGNVFDPRTVEFTLRKGPIFCGILLADEINRTPPKTQAALLEAMQERSVTLDGTRHALSPHFMVVATQNPIEQQGVYPLPEAQLDRFLFKLLVGYPDAAEEARIVAEYGKRSGVQRPDAFAIQPQVTAEELSAARAAVGEVKLVDEVVAYIVRLVRATRETADFESGASPRAAIMLANAARARAALQGRDYVIPDDVKQLAASVLRHRTLLSPAAEIEGRRVEMIVADLVERTEAPR